MCFLKITIWYTDFLSNCNICQRKLKNSYFWMSKYSRFNVEYCFYNIRNHLKYFLKTVIFVSLNIKIFLLLVIKYSLLVLNFESCFNNLSNLICYLGTNWILQHASDIHLFLEKLNSACSYLLHMRHFYGFPFSLFA